MDGLLSINRGRPLAGRSQASMFFQGGLGRLFPIPLHSVRSRRSRPFLHTRAATNRVQTPIRIKRSAMICQPPWRPGRPRRTLVPRCVQGVLHRPMAAGLPAPIPSWLPSRAIRIPCKSVTATRSPIQTRWLSHQSPNPGWPVAVVTHTKQRATSNGTPSFKMW